MDAKEMLEEAIELVDGDRETTHGSMYENHTNIAHLWNGYLHDKETLTASDVANMMELLKIARRKLGVFNNEDYVDGAGYAAVAFECAKEQVAQSMENSMDKLFDDVIVETEKRKSGSLQRDGSLAPFDK
jgi:hypothetical protein